MSDCNNDQNEDPMDDSTETILMALDQISQTIDVMTSVVGRLRHFVQEQELASKSASNSISRSVSDSVSEPVSESEIREAMRQDRTLH